MSSQISETSRKASDLLRAVELEPTDCLIVSNRQVGFEAHESYKISYSSLLSALQSDIIKDLSFGTMLTADDLDYVRIDHEHNGKNVPTKYTLDKVSTDVDFSKLTLVGQFIISDWNSSTAHKVFFPPREAGATSPYHIGEIQLFCSSTALVSKDQILRQINYIGGFNGWTYADGSIYSKKTNFYNFSKAYDKLEKVNADQFKVPDLRTFFRANQTSYDDPMKFVSAETALPMHSHAFSSGQQVVTLLSSQVPAVVTAKASEAYSIYAKQFNGHFDIAHGQSLGVVHQPISQLSTDFTFSAHDLSRKQTGTNAFDPAVEQHPTYIQVIPMIFIGKET